MYNLSLCPVAGGKDTVVFVDKDDHQKPAEVKFEMPEEEAPGQAFHCHTFTDYVGIYVNKNT